MATEMRSAVYTPKNIVENSSFDSFMLCFQGVFNVTLRKMMLYCLKFGKESGNTVSFKFFQQFFPFIAQFNSSEIIKKIVLFFARKYLCSFK